ncbi:serine protease inhibitor Kazal-type 1-like [Haematobia irritans]|uniref:Putative pancreatic secretory trypsin inhibitor n=1 Tax=Haematobia irritans TaxID=7368 RepID=A0A1L8EHJ7_HAEIR
MKVFVVFTLVLMAILALVSADIRVAADEKEADAPCKCARILDPVCATDSQTYPNSCEFLCAQKKLARKGRSIGLAHAGRC